MYFPATRVLTVLELLQSRQRVSGPELAERLEVNTRTVRRYIMMLQDLGIPVEAERGRHGSYRLRPGFKLPPLMFTEEEALALTLGLLAARRLDLAAAVPAVEGALAKIERVLPAEVRERVQGLQETLVFEFPRRGKGPSGPVLVTLSEGVRQEKRVWLRYQAWGAEASERKVDPYGLVYRAGFWYVAGYCHLRKDIRVFRLDRILEAELRTATFTRPPDFDCLEHVTRAIAMTPAQWEVDVLLQNITLEEVQHRLPPALALLDNEPGGVCFRCYVSDLDWIAYILVGLECPFIVRQPVQLQAALQRLAARTARLAEEAFQEI